MKLIIREYLSSLRERGELDAILPDLLSQLGLNVYSRPGRGTRQDGVDVGAVGSIDGGEEKVYLFSIKPGDLTRREWDGDSLQSLRPSLNEILDSYIPHRLPAEHRGKKIVICISLGGDIQEQVRPQLTGFIAQNTAKNITFEEWNGDKIASLIQANFLREDLLPKDAQSHLRKSLALLDEPEASYHNFAALIDSLSNIKTDDDATRLTAMRQMSICLWILFAWAREARNVEAAYLSSELTLLHAWKILRLYAGQKTKMQRSTERTFLSIFLAYQEICDEFLSTNVLPHADKLHGVSSAVRSSCGLDVNLKLFDLLGRMALNGIWTYWRLLRCAQDEEEQRRQLLTRISEHVSAIKSLISSNPVLFLPTKDDQAIDIFITASLMVLEERNRDDVITWLNEILARAIFAYQTHGQYPCVINSYYELLSHPKAGDEEYRKNATSGSILYPSISLWAALLNASETYSKVAWFKKTHLQHCNFQYWYPDDRSEENIYTNDASHGATLSDVCVDRAENEFLEQLFGECKRSPHFMELSAIKYGWWPLIIVSCRHFRLPPPLHFLEGLRNTSTGPIADGE